MEEVPQKTGSCQHGKCHKKYVLILGMVLLAAIVIVSILRDRIVNPQRNQVTVVGQGRVTFQPDTANVTLGVQVDKTPTADGALKQLNSKMAKIVEAIRALGIDEEDIKTQAYSLTTQYDYPDGRIVPSGYNANQQLVVKIKQIQVNPELTAKVIEAASSAGSNQVLGVSFDTTDISTLKNEARLKAIREAKSRSGSIAAAAGVKLGKVIGWYDSILQSPDMTGAYGYGGMGGGGAEAMKSAVASPQIPSGSQEIVVEVGLNYEVK